jgi:hypothetical protein
MGESISERAVPVPATLVAIIAKISITRAAARRIGIIPNRIVTSCLRPTAVGFNIIVKTCLTRKFLSNRLVLQGSAAEQAACLDAVEDELNGQRRQQNTDNSGDHGQAG